MGFKCGIVGLPNVGKSTLFNALTKSNIDAENFPFCTIEPNAGVVTVPDNRLKQISNIVKPQRMIPTMMEFVDIAGLVAGASKGEGLGNKFLANIRETDAIAHVVRCFDDDNVIHVANSISPADDIDVINLELALADLESCEKQYQRVLKTSRNGDKEAITQKELLQKTILHLEQGKPVRSMILTEDESILIRSFHLLTLKPTMYIANVNEDGFSNNPHLEVVKKIAQEENALIVPICNKLEAEIAELTEEEATEFLIELGMNEPSLDRLIRTGYQLLQLQTYFTAGPKEVRAWTIPINTKAPQAAGVIHTDFERGFIRSEVISYNDFIQYKGEQGAKEAGRLRIEGKEYPVKDGDIMHFRFNV